MASQDQSKVRAFVDTHGIAHTGNFDVRIAGLAGPFTEFMPALGVTFDREQLGDVETVDGLPATVARMEDARSITMTMYDTVDRYLESQMRQWMAQASPKLRKASRMSSYAREVTLIERHIHVNSSLNGIESGSPFNKAGIREAAAGAAARALVPIEDSARFAIAQAAADLQTKFHTGWFNKNIDDIRQIPTLRARIFQNALDSQEFQVVERRNVYLAIPVGNIQTNADISGKGGLATVEINLRIVGEQPLTENGQQRRTTIQGVNPLEFAP